MNAPKISVVIPSYNKVKFINKTLKSIFDQNYPNLEVVVQDGGSTDGTLEIIKKYPVILESKKDNGQLDALNKGFKKATGDILTFINADDCYAAGAFSNISHAYNKNPYALWFAGQGIVINKSDIEIAKPVTWYKNILLSLNSNRYLLITNYLIQPSIFFTNEAYQKYGPFTGTLDFVMEYEMWLKLAKISMPVVIHHVISKFRIENNTKTKRMFNKLLHEDKLIVKKFTRLFDIF